MLVSYRMVISARLVMFIMRMRAGDSDKWLAARAAERQKRLLEK